MSHITKITTNLKSPNGAEYAVPLGPKTLLLGNNESNKSAVVEAAMLARTGSVFGLPYKDKAVRSGEYLATLMPEGASKLSILAQMSNGSGDASFEYERGHRPHRTGPETTALVLTDIRDRMGASDEGRARFLYQHLRPHTDTEVLLARLPAALADVLKEVCPDLTDLNAAIKKIDAQLKLVKESLAAATAMLAVPGSVRTVTQAEVTASIGAFKDAHSVVVLRALAPLLTPEQLARLLENLGGNARLRAAPDLDAAQTSMAQALTDHRLSTALRVADGASTRSSAKKGMLGSIRKVLVEAIFAGIKVPLEGLAMRASRFLPEGESLELTVIEKTVRPWLVRGGASYHAVSGSTEQRVLTALACALAEPSDLIVVSDRAFDPETLALTMRSLSKAPCQVLVTSPVKPKGRKPAGWDVVELARTDGQALKVSV